MNFVAIDFETAASQRYSACSLALAVVRHNEVVDELYTLINPQTRFSWRNTQIHGIHQEDVANAPLFPEVWEHINQFFTPDQLVVAHNNSFDNSVLAATLKHYNIVAPAYLTLDTVKTSRHFMPNLANHKLDTVCSALNIDLHHHHNALDDAQACANILIAENRQYGPQSLRPFITMRG